MWKTRRHNLRDKSYSFIPFAGWMRSKPIVYSKVCSGDVEFSSIPNKCIDNLRCVNNPFEVRSLKNDGRDISVKKYVRIYGLLLVWLSKHFYPMLYLLSFLRFNWFEDGSTAAGIFSSIIPNNQHLLCLSRSLFIATTSRKFKKHGTMFIGALLPSRSLHAWVMEEERNVYAGDVYWTNYTPLAIMY